MPNASAQCTIDWQTGSAVAGPNGPAYAQFVRNENGGIAVYLGGEFTIAGTVPTQNIVRWDGTTWSALGEGGDSPVGAIVSYGNDLYVGEFF